MSDAAASLTLAAASSVQPDFPAPAARRGLDELAALAAGYVEAESSTNTRRAYHCDWSTWSAWCEAHQVQDLPASGDHVALFMLDQAQSGLAVPSLRRRLSAIRHRHKLADQPAPGGRLLAGVWPGIRNTHGRPSRQKRAILTSDLRRIVARLPTNLCGLRDKAILLVGFASALRREELASMVVDGPGADERARRVEFTAAGLVITLGRSKGDQEGKGAVVGVPNGHSELCPVRALSDWMAAAGIVSGPIFRSIDRWGNLSAEELNPKSVCAIVKAGAVSIGVDPATVGAHSLRAGMVTQALLNGVDLPTIMKQSRHKRVETMALYVRLADLFQRSAAGALGL